MKKYHHYCVMICWAKEQFIISEPAYSLWTGQKHVRGEESAIKHSTVPDCLKHFHWFYYLIASS